MASSTFPPPILSLLEKSRIDWDSIENFMTENEGAVDLEQLYPVLVNRLSTSSRPIDDAMNLVCFRDGVVMKPLIPRLIESMLNVLSVEPILELVRRLFEWAHTVYGLNGAYRFILLCQPFFKTTLSKKYAEKFEAVVFEMAKSLDIQHGENFMQLRLLDIAAAAKKLNIDLDVLGCLRSVRGQLFQKTDASGNTCLNYLLGRGRSHLRSMGEAMSVMYACPAEIGIANHEGTLPLHNVFIPAEEMVMNSSTVLNCSTSIEMFLFMVDHCPENMSHRSREKFGQIAFHIIISHGLSTIKSMLTIQRRNSSNMNSNDHLIIYVQRFVAWVETAIRDDHHLLSCVDDVGLTALHRLITAGGAKGEKFMIYRRNRPSEKERHVSRLVKKLATPKVVWIASESGKLPLHTALELHVDLIDELVSVAPETVERRDPDSCLYPFQMASRDTTLLGLGATYALLRMAPHLVATALTDESASHLGNLKRMEAAKLELKASRIRIKHARHLNKMKEEYRETRKRYRDVENELLAEVKRLRRKDVSNTPS